MIIDGKENHQYMHFLYLQAPSLELLLQTYTSTVSLE